MQSVATKTRVSQITILVAISLFYEYTNWQEGIWVVISTVVVAGPFSTFLSFEKAKNRFLGTLVGLILPLAWSITCGLIRPNYQW